MHLVTSARGACTSRACGVAGWLRELRTLPRGSARRCAGASARARLQARISRRAPVVGGLQGACGSQLEEWLPRTPARRIVDGHRGAPISVSPRSRAPACRHRSPRARITFLARQHHGTNTGAARWRRRFPHRGQLASGLPLRTRCGTSRSPPGPAPRAPPSACSSSRTSSGHHRPLSPSSTRNAHDERSRYSDRAGRLDALGTPSPRRCPPCPPPVTKSMRLRSSSPSPGGGHVAEQRDARSGLRSGQAPAVVRRRFYHRGVLGRVGPIRRSLALPSVATLVFGHSCAPPGSRRAPAAAAGMRASKNYPALVGRAALAGGLQRRVVCASMCARAGRASNAPP